MSDETLRQLEGVLLKVLRDASAAMSPSDLLRAANAQRPAEATPQDFRIALWNLLNTGAVTQTEDRCIQSLKPETSAA
jgi:hypothetical protein